MNIIKSFKDAWDIYLSNFKVIIFISLLIDLFILVLQMVATNNKLLFSFVFILVVWMQIVFVKLKRGEKIGIKESFDVFGKGRESSRLFGGLAVGLLLAVPSLFFMIFASLISRSFLLASFVITMVYLFFFTILLMFSLLSLVDRKLPIFESYKFAFRLIQNNGILKHGFFYLLAIALNFAFAVIGGLINQMLGSNIPIGEIITILTLPMLFGPLACAYDDDLKKALD